MNFSLDWIFHIAEIAIGLGSLVYAYGRLNAKVEEMDRQGTDKFNKLEKYSSEFFDRLEKIEREQAVQQEINKNLDLNWKRIETKLDTIEGLLRGRGADGKQK